MRAMEAVSDSFKGAIEPIVDKFSTDRGVDEDSRSDRIASLTQLDLKKKIPTIPDSDADLERHNQEFDNLIACAYAGRKAPTAIDKLHLYGQGFQPGTTRRRVYDLCVRRAQMDGRLPQEAKEVAEEIRAELST